MDPEVRGCSGRASGRGGRADGGATLSASSTAAEWVPSLCGLRGVHALQPEASEGHEVQDVGAQRCGRLHGKGDPGARELPTVAVLLSGVPYGDDHAGRHQPRASPSLRRSHGEVERSLPDVLALADLGGREGAVRASLEVEAEGDDGYVSGRSTTEGLGSREALERVVRMLVDDQVYWQEQVHTPATVWISHDEKGSPKTPAERLAPGVFPGGAQALAVDIEGQAKGGNTQGEGGARRQSLRDKRAARKRRLAEDRDELHRLRDLRDGGSGGAASKGKGGGKSGKGKGNEEQLCYAWNNNNGTCAGLAPGQACKANVKRVHKCTVCKSPGHRSLSCLRGKGS